MQIIRKKLISQFTSISENGVKMKFTPFLTPKWGVKYFSQKSFRSSSYSYFPPDFNQIIRKSNNLIYFNLENGVKMTFPPIFGAFFVEKQGSIPRFSLLILSLCRMEYDLR